MKCLDSSFIIDFLRNKSIAVKKAESIQNEKLVTTRINFFEVMQGELRRHPVYDEHVSKAREFFERVEVLELNELNSFKASQISAKLIANGTSINTQDCLIAGIILMQGCKSIITNDADFKKIKELDVETY